LILLLDAGVPWDVAIAMSPTRRMAFRVARDELNGRAFDWKNRRFKDRSFDWKTGRFVEGN
jgi:hypothetical protein